MATQKQQVQNSFGTGNVERTEERPARRLRFQIEALEQRITPDIVWGDEPIGFTDPPPGDLPPGFP
jgi:hypothetical protein